MNHKVSIIIPAYNVEEYISNCISSVLSQTFKDIEVIVIDDGSTDSTVEKIKTFSDDRICFIQQTNKGLSATRNRGIIEATGEYILFVDGDDTIHTDTINTCYILAQKNAVEAVTFDGIDFYIKAGKRHKCKRNYFDRSKRLKEGIYKGKEFLKIATYNNSIVSSACLFFWRKEHLVQFLFKDGMIHEDVLFYYEVLPQLKSIYYLPMMYYERIQRSESITNSLPSINTISSYKYIYEYILQQYQNALPEDKTMWRKILKKNVLQIGRHTKRYLCSNKKYKYKFCNIALGLLRKGDLQVALQGHFYFTLAFFYYFVFDLWKNKKHLQCC